MDFRDYAGLKPAGMRAGVCGVVLLLGCAVAGAQSESSDIFAPEQIRAGADIYARICAPCHGARMADPNAASDLRKFPRDQKSRFVRSVTHGKNQMPPWDGLLKVEDVEALWAYVMAGERQ